MTVEVSLSRPSLAKPKADCSNLPSLSSTTIIDIRKERDEYSILQDIKTGLRPNNGHDKTLPTLLLYDVNGLRLFEKITYLEEYYLTNMEIKVLEEYADQIAEKIKPNSIILELGSG
jgi:L-histidine Nalpha-methyltransferase / hercynylcysteine S-oxide synthase